MILDATAGNRVIWGKNKHPEGVIFFDKEQDLAIPPDVVGTWDKLPFLDNSFDCVIFDPPFYAGSYCPWFYNNPKRPKNRLGGNWYGYPFKNKHEMRTQLLLAQKEFSRVSSRLCLKWQGDDIPIDRVLTLFINWQPVFIQPIKSKYKRGKESCYWVKMVRKAYKAPAPT